MSRSLVPCRLPSAASPLSATPDAVPIARTPAYSEREKRSKATIEFREPVQTLERTTKRE